jgi:hypothetical protein
MNDPAESGYWPLPFAPLQALLDYWLAKRGPSRRCPDKTEIDPVDLRPLLPDLILYDAAPDDGQFRYRLVGSRATQMIGREARGLTQVQVHGNPTDEALLREIARTQNEYAWIAREFVGGFRVSRLAVPKRDHIQFARLTLPLTEERGAARHLITIMVATARVPHADVAFGVDLMRLAPIPLPEAVAALQIKNFAWPIAPTK